MLNNLRFSSGFVFIVGSSFEQNQQFN